MNLVLAFAFLLFTQACLHSMEEDLDRQNTEIRASDNIRRLLELQPRLVWRSINKKYFVSSALRQLMEEQDTISLASDPTVCGDILHRDSILI